jgi:Holliday junction resolvase RusA-like endonuclease
MPITAISIRLALPPPILSPNARPNVFKKARAIRSYRQAAELRALIALDRREPPRWPLTRVEYLFRLCGRRRRDIDNLLAAAKSALDGLVDAGILADDAGAEIEGRRIPGQGDLLITIWPRED